MRTALVALLLVAALALLLRLSEKKFIYFPSKYPAGNWEAAGLGLAVENVYFTTSDGVQLHGWLVRHPQAVATLLWCHGNAGNISDRLDNLWRLAQLPIHVFLFDYRGYGRSQGSPDEEGLYLDAEAAYDALVSRPEIDSSRIFLFGRSLGGAVAAELALRRPAAGLILESTFTSARDMAWKTFRPFPVHWIIKSRFDTLDKIRRIRLPLLLLHGTQDDIVPFKMGQRLFEAASEPKQFYPIRGAGHNDTYLVGGDDYFEQFRLFLTRFSMPVSRE
jgi:fermentation-respiration switch protein FrsA (DUF1100 family)